MTTYRVTGTLLASQDARCYSRGLELIDVAHERVAVDRLVVARDEVAAAAQAAWVAAADGYATWRWAEGPEIAIEEVTT